ncbi:MAG: hypothetical protein ACOX1F_07235 [Erysipelotrichaceae bacterium]
MDKKSIKKITGSRYYLLGIGVIFLIFALLSSLVMEEAEINENKTPFSYTGIKFSEYEKAGEYVYLDVVWIDSFAYRETGDFIEEYCYAMDKENYIYVVCISEETLIEIENIYKENPENFSYRLQGYLYNLDGEVKEFAKDSIIDILGEDLSNVYDNFDLYFSSTFLDTVNKPYITSDEVVMVSILYFVLGCIFFAAGVLRVLKVGKLRQNKEYAQMIDELKRPSIWNIVSMKIALTDSYLFYYGGKLGFISYKEINMVVHEKNELFIATDSGIIKVGKCDSSLYEDIKSYIENKKQNMAENFGTA